MRCGACRAWTVVPCFWTRRTEVHRTPPTGVTRAGEVHPLVFPGRFEFRLARDLGKSRGELRRMSNREYMEWAAYYAWEADERARLEKEAAAARTR